jgi:hypothetical protein
MTESILARARALAAGKRALFVTNRRDESTRRILEKDLAMHIDWEDVTQVKTALTAAARISNGKYDLVFVATSFVAHKADSVIRTACRKSGTKLFSVARGGVLQMAQALLGRTER